MDVGSQSDVALTAKKSKALLCYLAAQTDSEASREKLAGLLWTDTAEEFARTNLRQCVAVVRKALRHDEQPSLRNRGDSVYLDPFVVASDLEKFNSLIESDHPDSLEQALNLYRGEILEGVGLDDCLFGEWLTTERHRYRQTLTLVCHKLLEHYRRSENFQRESVIAGKLLDIDGVDEIAHRSLMRNHHVLNRRHLALRQYDICKNNLLTDVGTSPESATQELYERILRDEPVAFEPSASETTIGDATKVDPQSNTRWQSWVWICGVVSLIVAIYVFYADEKPLVIHESTVSRLLDGAIAGDTTLRPKVAVLPFINLSKDPEQSYFSDGLSEDLITDLSQISGLVVIARASSFMYRDSEPNISRVAEDLGVSVVLRGSTRKVGNRVRINAQLINATSGIQIWAGRYDRNLSDILTLQDEISKTIVNELSVRLTENEQGRLDKSLLVNPDAYDLFLRSLRPIREITATGSEEARRILNQVVVLDDRFARAWSNLALTYGQDLNFGFANNRQQWMELGFQFANKAKDIDPMLPQLYFTLNGLHLADGAYDKSISAALRAIELDPNYADGYGALAQTLVFSGDTENAAKAIRQAKKLNPRFTFTYLWLDAQVHFLSGQFEKAVEVLEEINNRNPSFVPGRLLLISTYGQLSRIDDAEWEIAEMLTSRPDFSLEDERQVARYRLEKQKDMYIEGLKKAGL